MPVVFSNVKGMDTDFGQHILAQLERQPDRGYLSQQEMLGLKQFTSSLPERIRTYRQLREVEVRLLQSLVDRLPAELKQNEPALEQSIRQTILILRYAALGMLVDDVSLGQRRLEGWLTTMAEVYQTAEVDRHLYQALNDHLSRLLSSAQFDLIHPALEAAHQVLQAHDSIEKA